MQPAEDGTHPFGEHELHDVGLLRLPAGLPCQTRRDVFKHFVGGCRAPWRRRWSSRKTNMPGTRPGMRELTIVEPRSLEVIGRAHVSSAFDRGLRRDVGEQEGVMVGAELVVPVPIADKRIPDTRLAPEHFRGVKREARVFQNHILYILYI